MSEISELVGHVQALSGSTSPFLRKENWIWTIHPSLAIENNTLTLEQVTAVLNGKHVLGQPREIQEVRNAFIAYEHLETWNPSSQNDILAAHTMLMAGLLWSIRDSFELEVCRHLSRQSRGAYPGAYKEAPNEIHSRNNKGKTSE